MNAEANLAARLRPVDALEVLVLVDNVTDSLSTVPPGVVNENATLMKAGLREMSGEGKCCAHHGLSLVIAARSGSETHFIMFDAGPEAYAVARNGDRLGIPFRDIEALALSHGHWDHGGGLPEAVRRIYAANGGRRVPVHVNEGMFVRRAGTLPDGSCLPIKDVPGPEELEAAGAEVVNSPHARLIGSGFFYLSGEIPRVTSYEKGLPGQLKRTADGQSWEPDPWIRDERYLAVNVRGKGVVVFSMCSHAGVVNVLKDARTVFEAIPLHATMGGFHLAGPAVEPIIAQTVLDLLTFGLKRIVPAHCTGWRAFTALANACEAGVLIPSAVGRTFVF
jgi:7,8-dihydropterin-6-yl-methyl-4-(beta-D-ribofuranosyl)aminobenzene 5'-phosphate synthase